MKVSLSPLEFFHRHRQRWQEVGRVLDSKANLTTFCLDVAKKLNMNYKAPPVPIQLSYAANSVGNPMQQIVDGASTAKDDAAPEEDLNVDRLTEAFRLSAMEKHNIMC